MDPRSQESAGERQPLLGRVLFNHLPTRPPAASQPEPIYSCVSNPLSDLPVYTNIHRIRRDIISVVEDYLSVEQLRDVRINIAVVRPLVDKLHGLDDISVVYCLLVNRAQFLLEQSHHANRHNVNYTRAALCELVATRVLRRFNDDKSGPDQLLMLSHILIAAFGPFQGASDEVREEAMHKTSWMSSKTLPALEVAILTESKYFLSSTPCQKVIEAIYVGKIIYTPSSFLDIIPDHYKKKPIGLYDPRDAPLLNQYRLIVPRTRNIIEVGQFLLLLGLYVAVMAERDKDVDHFTALECAFSVYAFGWALDQVATILEHGWHVYTQNLWSFLDVSFTVIYFAYLCIRIHGWRLGSLEYAQQALDVLALGGLVLIPRLAFNLLSDNLVFLSLRSMMVDFFLLTALAAWCFLGFLLSLYWLGDGVHLPITISKWMMWIWFGLDGTGIQRSVEFHRLLGPAVMVLFAFLGNTLFLTVLVSMLSNTFSNIASNSTAEISYRRSVVTLEGVKSDQIFAYMPPFNIAAVTIFLPLKFVLSPRWFHKINVATIRIINLPLLLIIAFAERHLLDSNSGGDSEANSGRSTPAIPSQRQDTATRWWFWRKWKISTHRDIRAVFELPPPEDVIDEIRVDDELTKHLIRRQFTRLNSSNGNGFGSVKFGSQGSEGDHSGSKKSRRDSTFPGIATRLRGSIDEGMEGSSKGVEERLQSLENSMERIEMMLSRLLPTASDEGPFEIEGQSVSGSEVGPFAKAKRDETQQTMVDSKASLVEEPASLDS